MLSFGFFKIKTLYFAGTINFVDKECLQQSNGYDCGVHVICNAERLAECAYTHKEVGSCDMLVKINPFNKRKEILAIIKKIAKSD